MILIGKIVNAVGLKGEVKVYNYSDSCDSYQNLDAMWVGEEKMNIENFRLQKNMVILKLSGINNRDEAERAKGMELFITEEDLPELPEGQFYVRDLLGMDVAFEDGKKLGTISDVIQNTAQDLFEVVREDGSKVLIPKVDQFVLNIDADERTITVRLIEGMLDL